jgi:hypothetical protein
MKPGIADLSPGGLVYRARPYPLRGYPRSGLDTTWRRPTQRPKLLLGLGRYRSSARQTARSAPWRPRSIPMERRTKRHPRTLFHSDQTLGDMEMVDAANH